MEARNDKALFKIHQNHLDNVENQLFKTISHTHPSVRVTMPSPNTKPNARQKFLSSRKKKLDKINKTHEYPKINNNDSSEISRSISRDRSLLLKDEISKNFINPDEICLYDTLTSIKRPEDANEVIGNIENNYKINMMLKNDSYQKLAQEIWNLETLMTHKHSTNQLHEVSFWDYAQRLNNLYYKIDLWAKGQEEDDRIYFLSKLFALKNVVNSTKLSDSNYIDTLQIIFKNYNCKDPRAYYRKKISNLRVQNQEKYYEHFKKKNLGFLKTKSDFDEINKTNATPKVSFLVVSKPKCKFQ